MKEKNEPMMLQNKNIRLGEKSGRELLEAGTRRLRCSKIVFYTCYHTPVNNFDRYLLLFFSLL